MRKGDLVYRKNDKTKKLGILLSNAKMRKALVTQKTHVYYEVLWAGKTSKTYEAGIVLKLAEKKYDSRNTF